MTDKAAGDDQKIRERMRRLESLEVIIRECILNNVEITLSIKDGELILSELARQQKRIDELKLESIRLVEEKQEAELGE